MLINLYSYKTDALYFIQHVRKKIWLCVFFHLEKLNEIIGICQVFFFLIFRESQQTTILVDDLSTGSHWLITLHLHRLIIYR